MRCIEAVDVNWCTKAVFEQENYMIDFLQLVCIGRKWGGVLTSYLIQALIMAWLSYA